MNKDTLADFIIFILAGLGMVMLYAWNINYEFYGVPILFVAWFNIFLIKKVLTKDDYSPKQRKMIDISIVVTAIVSIYYIVEYCKNIHLVFHTNKTQAEYYIMFFSFALILFVLKNLITLLAIELLRKFNSKRYELLRFINIVFIPAYMLCYLMFIYLLVHYSNSTKTLVTGIIGSMSIMFGVLFSDIVAFKYMKSKRQAL